jgi:hypothetical protein
MGRLCESSMNHWFSGCLSRGVHSKQASDVYFKEAETNGLRLKKDKLQTRQLKRARLAKRAAPPAVSVGAVRQATVLSSSD